ncbi:MAG: ATP-binding cassette domain-containing protein [Treponema sp.]|jgi:ABC-2 type transport system ATP-binding protein|nr:ATP-binding cassette domain-containing protein [Treponema sp.]
MAFIEVRGVCKDYRIVKSRPGIAGAIVSLFHREYKVKKAVENVSFSIARGEIVGYIGPNGAGKSTTIKMLSGVLIPDAGEIVVGGIVPYRERKKNARRIGVVFGQRSQLYWDLPISDTFALYQKLYDIPDAVYRRNRERYVTLLDMADFMEQPARQLSLGQKMKANLALAMLHDPDVLYLDEPTIGLDVMSKQVLRDSISALNAEKNTTIMLTTHDMNDIEAVCRRIILIDKGHLLFDGNLGDFKARYEHSYTVKMEFVRPPAWIPAEGYSLLSDAAQVWTVKVDKSIRSKEALMYLIGRYDPENISVREQDIEDIIRGIFEV